jgi:Glutaminase
LGSRRPASIWRAIIATRRHFTCLNAYPITNRKAKLYGGVVDEMISDLRLQANIQRANPTTPLLQFLKQSLEKHAADNSGAVANYIPELAKANPAHFGISLATIDGYVYEVGDSTIPFQSNRFPKPLFSR